MGLTVAISTVPSGNMYDSNDTANQTIIDNRIDFLTMHDISIQDVTRVPISYDSDDYCRYREVTDHDKGAGMFDGAVVSADALVTRGRNHALFLPLADCVGAVIYDPCQNILMVSHLGRHSIEQNGGYNSVQFMVDSYGCAPDKLLVWLTPAPDSQTYPMLSFGNRSLKDVTLKQLKSAGILSGNINDNSADTVTDPSYYSHSEYLRGNQAEDGRYAIVAVMND